MPVELQGNRTATAKEYGYVKKFYPWFLHMTPTDKMIAYLVQERKQAIVNRETWLVIQKEAGKEGNRELAKFCKEEAAEALKWYRAACLLIGWVGHTPLPGDCPTRDPYEWPPELWPYLTHLENMTTIQ